MSSEISAHFLANFWYTKPKILPSDSEIYSIYLGVGNAPCSLVKTEEQYQSPLFFSKESSLDSKLNNTFQ